MRVRRSAPIRISDALEDSYDATGRWRDERDAAFDEENQPDDRPGIRGDDVDEPDSGAVAVERSARRRVRRWALVVALPACALLAALAAPVAMRAARHAPRVGHRPSPVRALPRPPGSVRLDGPRARPRRVRDARPRRRHVLPRRRRPRSRVAVGRVVPAPAPAVRAAGQPGGEFVLGAR